MATVYVQRVGGVITGVYRLPQPGYATEAVDDGSAEVVAFLAGPTAAQKQSAARTAADYLLSLPGDGQQVLIRALALTVLDEVNVLREWIVSFKAATAAATNLSTLQSRVAALPDLPDRTKAQLINAIQNKTDGGNAD